MNFKLPRPTPALAVASTALFVALGGPAIAQQAVQKGLNADKVDGYSASKRGKANTIPVIGANGKLPSRLGAIGPKGDTGAAGPAGAAGAAGAAGTARAYGLVSPGGALTRSKNATVIHSAIDASSTGQGIYCIVPAAGSGIDSATTGISLTVEQTGLAQGQDQDYVAQWNAVNTAKCPAGSFQVMTYVNDSNNSTNVSGGGGGTVPRFTHRLSDVGFFFLIP